MKKCIWINKKYVFVALDIFNKIQHNENDNIKIENRLEAWLVFMSMDNPEDVVSIISKYPDFKELYEQVYDICRNIEGVMDMFSKELRILDRNTVQLMIDEMQDDLEQKREELKEKQGELEQKREELKQTQGELKEKQGELEQTQGELMQKNEKLEQLKKQYEQAMKEIKELRG